MELWDLLDGLRGTTQITDWLLPKETRSHHRSGLQPKASVARPSSESVVVGGTAPSRRTAGHLRGGSLTCGVCGTPRRRTTSSQTFSAKPSFFPPEPNLGRPRFRDPQASGTTEDRKWMEGKPGEVTHTPA